MKSAIGPAVIYVNPSLGPASFSICALAVSNPNPNASVNSILFIILLCVVFDF